jgi:mono/diheme cytochrome c family protein
LSAERIAVVGLALLAGACRQDMHDQPKYKPLAPSAFFADGKAARTPVKGTVARGQLRAEEAFYTGRAGGERVTRIPLAVTRSLVERGRERYRIFCSPCHGGLGDGQGMVVRRGFRQPPSFHQDRLREAPPGHYFDVITHGFGAMASYASRIPPEDRWAIIAYVRALQLSQRARLEDVPPERRKELESAP